MNMLLPGDLPLTVPNTARLLLRLRMTRPTRFRLHHGGAVHGLLCASLGHELPSGLTPYAPESGRVRFESGEAYQLGLTLAGPARPFATRLASRIAAVGRPGCDSSTAGSSIEAPMAALAGNFDVEEVVDLGPPSLEQVAAQAAALAGLPAVRIRFVSPLRLRVSEGPRSKVRRLLGPHDFDPSVFLHRLWQRCHLMRAGAYAHPSTVPMPSSTVSLQSASLFQLDLPVIGKARRTDRPQGISFGGVVGEVALRGLPAPWLALLALGQHFHLGANTHYGFGRYILPDVSRASEQPFPPATTLLARMAEPSNLARALHRLLREAGTPGQRDPMLQALAQRHTEALLALREEILAGSYQPDPLVGIVEPIPHGRWRPRAVPSARDHLLQLATANVLGPPTHRAVFDSAWAADHGVAQGEGRHSFERAARAGFRHQAPIDLTTFYDAIPRLVIDGKLEAFFPNEPLVALVRQWLTGPISFQGQEIERVDSLPPGTPLTPLLTRFLLPELDRALLRPSMRLLRSGSRYVLAMGDLGAMRARAHEASAAMAPAFGSNQPNLHLRGLECSELGRRFFRVMQASESSTAAGLEFDNEPRPRDAWLLGIPFELAKSLRAKRALRPRLLAMPPRGVSSTRNH